MADRARFLGRPLAADRLFVIAGPCVIEGEALTFDVAARLKEICGRLSIDLVFKSSYRKDNRTAVDSYTGPEMEEGLRILARVRDELELPVLTDVHCRLEIGPAAAVASVLQIPAFLCRQTRLMQEAARTGRVVNVKKGQFLAPADTARILEKLRAARADGEYWLTERGTSFGYRDLVVDPRAIATMRDLDCTVVYDATHSLQHPGTGGDRRFARPLARAAIAAGADGLFLETHPDPDHALSDPTTQLPLDSIPDFLEEMVEWKKVQATQVGRGRIRP